MSSNRKLNKHLRENFNFDYNFRNYSRLFSGKVQVCRVRDYGYYTELDIKIYGEYSHSFLDSTSPSNQDFISRYKSRYSTRRNLWRLRSDHKKIFTLIHRLISPHTNFGVKNIEWVDEDYFEGKKISKLHL